MALGYDYSPLDSAADRLSTMLRRHRGLPLEGRQRELAHSSFADVALWCLMARDRGRGLDPYKNRADVIDLALQVSGDFPAILGAELDKILLARYVAARPTYRRLARPITFKSFRPHQAIRATGFPDLLKTNETGEFKFGTLADGRESIVLGTYGRLVGLTRAALVNDDVGAFVALAEQAADRAAEVQDRLFFAACIAPNGGLGPTLGDGETVYSLAHANVTGAGTLEAVLGEARARLARQTAPDGGALNARAAVVLVAPEYLETAEGLLAERAKLGEQTLEKIVPLADAALTGTRFYVLADPARVPQYVYGLLEGSFGEPTLILRRAWETEGLEARVSMDFGCGAVDYRGGVTGAGA